LDGLEDDNNNLGHNSVVVEPNGEISLITTTCQGRALHYFIKYY